MGHACSKFHQALAEKMSKKSGEKYDFLSSSEGNIVVWGSRSLRQNIDVGGEDFSQSLRELGL